MSEAEVLINEFDAPWKVALEEYLEAFLLLCVAAHQAALKTRHDAPARCRERFRLIKHLYRGGLERKQIIGLFRLISWLTLLPKVPKEFELQFRAEVATFEQSKAPMELLSPIE